MTPKELSALYDIKRTLERIKEYCENRSLSCYGEYERWKHVVSEANYGLIKVRDVERSAK
jgi:hypothetical protein